VGGRNLLSRRHGPTLRALLVLVDAVTAGFVGVLVYQAAAHPGTSLGEFLDVFWVRAILYAAVWVGLLYLNGAYRPRAYWSIGGEARSVVTATFWLAVLGLGALIVFGATETDRGYVLLLFPIQGIVTIVTRTGLRATLTVFRRRGFDTRTLLILGTGEPATAFAERVRHNPSLGVKIVGFLGDRLPEGYRSELYLGTLHDLPRLLQEGIADEIAVCVPPTQWSVAEAYARLAHQEGLVVRVPLMVPRLASSARFLEDLEGRAVLSFANGPDELAGRAVKRLFDLVIALTAVLVLGPLMIAIALVLRLREGPGVIFRQTRVGIHGRPFTIYKFRTMTRDAESRMHEVAALSDTRGAAFKMVGDPRITRTGRMLRRLSLDELPQFFNVLAGDMSVVGPRPAPPREVQGYDLWHRRRLSVKPGITGLWQITARLDRDFDERAELDLVYIDHWSVWLDLEILFRTIPAIFKVPGH
jgi:exopolysaccharide biosynthesis polyprenyl glycosylphosphotransferase